MSHFPVYLQIFLNVYWDVPVAFEAGCLAGIHIRYIIIQTEFICFTGGFWILLPILIKNSSWVGGNCLGMSYHFDEFEWLLGNFVNYKSVLYVDIFLIYYSKMNPYREYFEKGCFFGIILFLGQIFFLPPAPKLWKISICLIFLLEKLWIYPLSFVFEGNNHKQKPKMTIIQNANVQFDFKGLLLKGFPLSKFEVLLQKRDF